MKHNYFQRFLILLMLLFSLTYLSYSQNKYKEISEGKEYWFGLPHCMKSSDEPVRWGMYPIELWISSKVDTKATIEAKDVNLQSQTVSISKNDFTIVSLPDNLENKESEVINNYGIHIYSDDLISVSVFVAYEWSGEAFRVIPVGCLGREYFTLNMYQDYVKMHDSNMEYKPGQIVICATEDNTQIQYIPTAETEKGIKHGQIGSVTLNKGQTFAIKSMILPNFNQDWSTDLTGTQIIASKPISVISGHTKGCFPRYTGTMYGIKADFVRNMLVDVMYPVELLGKEYVSAPLKYLNRTIHNLINDDKGDIIRFVATRDNTIIYKMRQDGSGLVQISPILKKREWFDILNQEIPAYYKSNNKVLVGQYGKSWVSNIPDPKPGLNEEPQNPTRSGQGMMFTLSPIERWYDSVIFCEHIKLDNFLYLTFRTEDADKILFDNQSITSRFGNIIMPILGTPYSYFVQYIESGNHRINSTDGQARFAGYAYGNYDALKDGFAYGYPLGLNYADYDCNDSIFVVDSIDCGYIEGVVKAIDLQADTSCAGIYDINFRKTESYNYNFNKDKKFKIGDTTYSFSIDIINSNDSALAVLNILSKSGQYIRREFKYVPEKIGVDITSIDYGLMIPPQTICKNFVIQNAGTAPMTVHNLYLKNGRSEFTINAELPFTLQPNEEKIIEVCANATQVTNLAVKDSLVAVLSCYEKALVGMQFRTDEPVVYIYDADWGKVPINQERMKNIEIKNTSNTDVEIYTIEWNDKVHFTRVERLNLPVTIPAGKSVEFSVYYKPDVADVQHTVRAVFTSNATRDKLYSDWTGIGIDASPLIEGYDWGRKRVIDEFAGTEEYEGKVIISCTGSETEALDVISLNISDNEDGIFRIASEIPTKLQSNKPVELIAYFAPKDEAVYDREIKLITSFSNIQKEVTARLIGVGLRPHIKVDGYDFGEKILVGNTKDGNGTVLHNNINPEFAMNLTISNLTIEGEDANAFKISQQWLNDHQFPIVIPIGENIEVPITFTAMHPGDHTANLVAKSDAPATENHIGELIGRGYTQGIVATDYQFEKIFIHTSRTGSVTLQNNGSEAITIIRNIQESKIATSGHSIDLEEFVITGWHTDDGLINNNTVPFEIQAGATLTVDITFTPVEERSEAIHSINLEYVTSVGNEISEITGFAMVLRTVVEIPKGYKSNPGEVITIDVNYRTNTNEPKQLEEGNITSITSFVYFKSIDKDDIKIFPEVEQGCVDIITTGTMTAGWQCEGVNVIDRRVLEVKMSGSTPLTGNGTLFKFNMNTYLSSNNNVIPVPCGLTQNSPYVLIESIPGDIQIAPVCVNTLRLIRLSGVDYSISQPTPNPAVNSASIDYSVGLEAQTVISLYNANGQKVATLVNELLKPGEYNLVINIDELGLSSGTYLYRFESGIYSETKQLVISR